MCGNASGRKGRGLEGGVSLGETMPIRMLGDRAREKYLLVMHLLKAMQQHRSILLIQDRLPDLDEVIRAYGQELTVKCSVMELAQREAVRDQRFTFRQRIRRNVRSVEELLVAQSAEGTLSSIGIKYSESKGLLVQPPSNDCGDVFPPDLLAIFRNAVR